MYHQFLQAEITKYKRFYSRDYLQGKKGDRPIEDRLSAPTSNYQDLAAFIQKSRPQNANDQRDNRVEPLDFLLEREHIYGFRSFDLREGVFLTDSGHVLYTVGSTVVSVDPTAEPLVQRVFSHHQCAVSCFDLYDEPESRMVVSSEMTGENNIAIWDPDTFKVKAVIKNMFERGVSKIKFSNSGKYIAVIGVSADKTQQMVVLSYSKIETFVKSGRKDDKIEAVCRITDQPVLDIVFDSQDQAVYYLAGRSLFIFRFATSQITEEARWGNYEPELLTCITYRKGKTILTSSIHGNVFFWDGRLASTQRTNASESARPTTAPSTASSGSTSPRATS